MILQLPQQDDQLRLRISPQGYFYNFCKVHGDPVDDRRRLIFKDGWVWASNRDYNGPEIAPPSDEGELRRLKLIYWTLKLKEVRRRRDEFMEQVRVLHETSRERSAPIAIESWVANAQGYLYPSAKDVDWLMLEKDLEFANLIVKDAEAELAKVNLEAEILV